MVFRTTVATSSLFCVWTFLECLVSLRRNKDKGRVTGYLSHVVLGAAFATSSLFSVGAILESVSAIGHIHQFRYIPLQGAPHFRKSCKLDQLSCVPAGSLSHDDHLRRKDSKECRPAPWERTPEGTPLSYGLLLHSYCICQHHDPLGLQHQQGARDSPQVTWAILGRELDVGPCRR